VKTAERIYRWLLRLYPRDFREEYGHEMWLLFRARSSEGSVRLWLQILGDLLFHAPKEHWSTMKQDLRYAVRMLLLRLRSSRHSPLVSEPTRSSSAPSTPSSCETLLSQIRTDSLTSTRHPAITSTHARPIRTISICGTVDVRVPGGLYRGVNHDGCERSASSSRAARERQLLRCSWGQNPIRSWVYARR
jgi:hypothetical protein